MAVPEQVRKQAEQVKQFYDDPPDNGEAPSNATPDPQPGARVPDPEDPNPSPPQDGGDDGPSDDTYAQRWRSLQGSYNASMRRNAELEQRVNQMQTLIATMAEAPPAPPPQPEDIRLLSEEEVSDYGDAVTVMRKVSREELTPLVQRLMQIERVLGDVTGKVVPQVQDLAVRQHHSAEQAFWATLAQHVPDWRSINDDPDFQGWLLEVDPLTGSTRQAFLEQAQQNLDAGRVAEFFAQWRGGSAPQPTPAPRGGNGASRTELEMQVAPGRGRSSAPTQRSQKTYATGDIAKFYDDVRKGVYRGREDEKNRLERDIFSAQQEGRIVG